MSSNLLSVKSPLCPICHKPVPLELAKTDENGVAIHEACYLGKLGLIVSAGDRVKPSGHRPEPGASKQRLEH